MRSGILPPALRAPFLSSTSPTQRHFWHRLPLVAYAKNRCCLPTQRLPTPIPFHFPRHLAHSARPFHCICVGKLFALNSPRLIPTPTLRCSALRVSGAFRAQVGRQPPLAFSEPSMSFCSIPHSKRARSPHLQSHSSLPQRKLPTISKPTATFYNTSATLAPSPDERTGKPLRSLRHCRQPLRYERAASGTRRVEAGRLLSVLCAMRSPTNSLSLHCIARHLGSLFAHSPLRSFGGNHLRSHGSPSPLIATSNAFD